MIWKYYIVEDYIEYGEEPIENLKHEYHDVYISFQGIIFFSQLVVI